MSSIDMVELYNSVKEPDTEIKSGRRRKPHNSYKNFTNPADIEEGPTTSIDFDSVVDDLPDVGAYFSKLLTKDVGEMTKKAVSVVKDSLTPGFLRRRRNIRIHTKHVDALEKEMDAFYGRTQDVIDEETAYKHKVRQNSRKVRDQLVSKQHLRVEAKEALVAAKQAAIDLEFVEFHRRREAQQKELEAALREAEDREIQAAEKSRIETRLHNISHYGELSKELGSEAAKVDRLKQLKGRNQAKVDQLIGEWEQREIALARQQVDEPRKTRDGSSLGIFDAGNPEFPPEVMADLKLQQQEKDAVNREWKQQKKLQLCGGQDSLVLEDVHEDVEYETHLFTAGAYTGYEEKDIKRLDVESELTKREQLYDAMQFDLRQMRDALVRMAEMREVLERDAQQIQQEILSLERDQLGPPRRLGRGDEIPTMDLWKRRSAATNKRLKELNDAMEKAEKRRSDITTQSIRVAKEIAMHKEQHVNAVEDLLEVNEGIGNLPVIVGRSLDVATGLGVRANPKELGDAVKHKSRLVNYREQSETALTLHRSKNVTERQLWLGRLKETGMKEDLESMISRIASISQRLQRTKVDNNKANLVDAITAFNASGAKLSPVRSKIVGVLPWYKHLQVLQSMNVAKYVTANMMGALTFEAPNPDHDDLDANANGITLADECNTGFAVGTISLSKDTLWVISLTITRQDMRHSLKNASSLDVSPLASEVDAADSISLDDGDGVVSVEDANTSPNKETKSKPQVHGSHKDFVRVQLGPNMQQLRTVGTYFNRKNPATGTVLYDVRHMIRGREFAFRFDFYSSSKEASAHLAVCTGIYEEFEVEELQETIDPRSGRVRVLSSFVKMVRVEEATGILRETRLLEELIRVEESKSLYWDTSIISNTWQRYNREFLARVLKAEILYQQDSHRKLVEKRQQETLKARGILGGGGGLLKEATLEKSRSRYLTKKRSQQASLIARAQAVLRKHIVLYDPERDDWKNLFVEDLSLHWVDDGLKAKIIHRVQEYDTTYEPIGPIFSLDLFRYKFFESPIQSLDTNTRMRLRERKLWQEELDSIAAKADEDVAKAEKSFARYKKKAIETFLSTKSDFMHKFTGTIRQRAEAAANNPESRSAIEAMIPDVLFDMRAGIVPINRQESKHTQASRVARERYLQSWEKDFREGVELKLLYSENDLYEEIAEKEKLHLQKVERIRKAATERSNKFRRLLHEQIADRKESLLEAVRFPPDVWQKVVNKPVHCEHLKTKAWANLYSKGVRCVNCGEELRELFNEESQRFGYGSGGSRELWAGVLRHRENEAAYRPQDKKGADSLDAVEQERLRLEKERRVMEEEEVFFYDFQDLRAIYEIDARHAKSIKAAGVFRQGLQWTANELEQYEQRRIMHHKASLEAAGLPESMLDDFDPLAEVEQPPPTFRAEDERRHAQYQEFLYAMGRLHNFRRKLFEFKRRRLELLDTRSMAAAVLELLHKDARQYSASLDELEFDLERSARLLSIFDRAERLWQQATQITSHARREKKRAEMARVGCWDEVDEITEKLVMTQDELRTLLREKVRMERRLQDADALVVQRSSAYTAAVSAYTTRQEACRALEYAMPGTLVNTQFGQCVVIAYRVRDDILIVSLPFCHPPARAYVSLSSIIERERAFQSAEMRLMAAEDDASLRVRLAVNLELKRENHAMRQEDELSRRMELFNAHSRAETVNTSAVITAAVYENYLITKTKQYEQMREQQVETEVGKRRAEAQKRHEEYIGPPDQRPKRLSRWDIIQLRKQLRIDLRRTFIARAATNAEKQLSERASGKRSDFVLGVTCEQIASVVVDEMIFELVYEAFHEGIAAKTVSERQSGIFFSSNTVRASTGAPLPVTTIVSSITASVNKKNGSSDGMQYPVYHALANTWQQRKDNLRRDLSLRTGLLERTLARARKQLAAGIRDGLVPEGIQALVTLGETGLSISRNIVKPSVANDDPIAAAADLESRAAIIAARRERRRAAKAEKARQRHLCEEMQKEELLTREFVRWELRESLRERRLMREEERIGMMIRRGEERLRKEAEAMLLGNDADGDGRPGTGAGRLSNAVTAELAAKRDISLSYERRRQELKDLTIERRRRAEDQMLMEAEDLLSQQLREMDRVEKARQAYRNEMGEDSTGEDVGGNLHMLALMTSAVSEAGYNLADMEVQMKKGVLEVPDWLTVPEGFYEWTASMQNRFIRMHTLIHFKELARKKRIARDEMRLSKLERKSFSLWSKLSLISQHCEQTTELSLMESQEDLQDAVAKASDIRSNLDRLERFCRDKGSEELKLSSELRRQRDIARRRDADLEEASLWLEVCLRRSRNRDKLKRHVYETCKWVDTDSINGFPQRFSTEHLRERLYLTYFREIVMQITTQSEIIATERLLLNTQRQLSDNKNKLRDRHGCMRRLLREMQADEYLRMKRSYLCQKLFAKHRHAVLSLRFGGWVRYYLWNRGNKEAYTLKYSVLRQQLAIDRQFRRQLLSQEQQRQMFPTESITSGPISEPQTLMHRVRERVVQCQSCHQYFLGSQNYALACNFHPGWYEMSCPSTCTQPGLTPQCVMHRVRRWKCCLREERDATGCARRFHAPPASDPAFDNVLANIQRRDADSIKKLDEDWRAMSDDVDWPRKTHETRRKRLEEIEQLAISEREIAKRYGELKFV